MNNIEILEHLEKMQKTFIEDGLQGYEMVIVNTKNLIENLIQRNKDLEQILELMSKSLDNISYDQIPIAIEELKFKLHDLEQIEKEHKEENGRLRNRIKELEGIYTTAYNMGKAYVNIKWKEKIIKKAKEYKETKQKVGEYMAIALEELLKESDK